MSHFLTKAECVDRVRARIREFKSTLDYCAPEVIEQKWTEFEHSMTDLTIDTWNNVEQLHNV